jgi:RNA polymerase sigma factor (sigma-70 family)
MDLIALPEKDSVAVRPAFEPFFRANFERVARTAALVAGDPASGQDLAQEAFLRLHASWELISSEDHARNFVYKAAIHRARSHVRKHRSVVMVGLTPREGTGGQPAEQQDEIGPDVLAALAALPYRQRACVVLIDLADMDSASAGRALGISPNTVRVHLMRGRDALRRALGVTSVEVADEG